MGDVIVEMVFVVFNLCIIFCNGIGVDNVFLFICFFCGIVVINILGSNVFVVVEFVIVFMFIVLCCVVEVDKRIRGGEWVLSIEVFVLGFGGKKVGLVGMGDIVYEFVKLFCVFGCEVFIYLFFFLEFRWIVEDI